MMGMKKNSKLLLLVVILLPILTAGLGALVGMVKNAQTMLTLGILGFIIGLIGSLVLWYTRNMKYSGIGVSRVPEKMEYWPKDIDDKI
jgi:uncharacterized membrane protein